MKFSKFLSITLLSLMLASCNNPSGGPAGGSDKGKTTVTLWAWGDEDEVNVFQNLAREYNANNQDNVYINFVKRPSNSYYSGLETALTGRQAPDIFYVGDSMVKRYAKAGYLEDLTSYINSSSEIDLDDIWKTLMERYQFNPNTYQNSADAEIWGLPKDISPTVIFYNEDAFKAQGITVISAKDDDGDGKVTFNGNTYDAIGYDATNKVFNNKIAMTFEELDAISKILSTGKTNASKNQTRWAYYSSWWFYAGWSVGGDCIQFTESNDAAYNGGYYEFTLDNDNPNYRVLKDCTVNSNSYKAGEFVSFDDINYLAENSSKASELVGDGSLKALPSIRDMFEYWVSYFKEGYSPKPMDIGNSLSLFTSQDVAMYVDGRYDVVTFREDCNFAWDVAPLPRHKDGVSAGHSGSMCISMSKKSKVKAEAFKAIEYLSGKTGQDALAKTGFNVPNQISLAKDPNANFLNSELRPYNNEIFLDAAEVQKGGDWTYLADDVWIELWAPTLNTDVLNGSKTIDSLFSEYKKTVNDYLKTYTQK